MHGYASKLLGDRVVVMKRFLPLLILGLSLNGAIAHFALAQASSSPEPTPGTQPIAPAVQTLPNQPSVGPDVSMPTPPASSSIPQGSGVIDGNDPLLQPPPLPTGQASLIGGIVIKIDRVRERLTVKPFGGKNMTIYFDDRSHLYRDGVETTMLGIHKGDRVYVDSLTDGGHVLAKNIRVVHTLGENADARGQLMGYRNGHIQMRDELSDMPVTFSVDANTVVRSEHGIGSTANLLPGSLIQVRFAPGQQSIGIAREIIIFAAPGSLFTFAGRVTNLDVSRGTMALANDRDNKSYEILFDPADAEYEQVGVGSGVTVTAMFDGAHYMARNLTIDQGPAR